MHRGSEHEKQLGSTHALNMAWPVLICTQVQVLKHFKLTHYQTLVGKIGAPPQLGDTENKSQKRP